MSIIGSTEWQIKTGTMDLQAGRSYLKGYLRYALMLDCSIQQIVIRKGAGDFEINSRILSRAEVYWAWRKLRREWRLALYYRLVAGMSVEETAEILAKAHRVAIGRWMVYKYIQFGIDEMMERVFEKLEGAV